MNIKVRPVVASLGAALDVESNNALSADATVEINGGHIHYLGE
jgi:hypothetical protein